MFSLGHIAGLVALENSDLRAADIMASADQGDAHVVGASTALARVFQQIRKFAEVDAPVLVTGETGTGKELAARAIHDRSQFRKGPFVSINCAGLPTSIIESELFGYERGAFTGAIKQKIGRIEAARGGTLFLDEIGDLPHRGPGPPAALPAGKDHRAPRRHQVDHRRHPRHRRHQRQPGRRHQGRRVPRGPLLPAQRPHHRHAAAARARRRRPAARHLFPAQVLLRAEAAEARLPGRRAREDAALSLARQRARAHQHDPPRRRDGRGPLADGAGHHLLRIRPRPIACRCPISPPRARSSRKS